MDTWFQEKFDGLRVFSSSFVLVENLTRHLQKPANGRREEVAAERLAERQISEFLKLVQDQLPHYHRFVVLDRSSNIIAQFPA